MEGKGVAAAGIGAILAMIGMVITLLNNAIDKESDKRREADTQLHERLTGLNDRLTRQGKTIAKEIGSNDAEISHIKEKISYHGDILKQYFVGDTQVPANSRMIRRGQEWGGDPHRERPPR